MKYLLAYLLIGISFCVSAIAQTGGEELLNKLQNRFDSVDNLSADFSQSTNGKTYLSGKIFFKKKNKIRIDTKRLLIISNGETTWNYNKKENKVIISNYDESDPGVFSINEIIYKYPEECEVKSEFINNEDVLVLIPNTYTFNFDSVKIWLNDESLIDKVIVDDPTMGKTEVIFSNYKINNNLPDTDFSFTPPEGSKIIDLR